MGEAILMNGGFFAHGDLDVDAPIYRCIKFIHLLDILKNHHLYFRQVLCWEDTWEFPSRFLPDTREDVGPAIWAIRQANRACEDFFGTCWTDNVDSDALWRIYSGPQKDGVCIETTPRKLFQSIDFSFAAGGFIDGFIGPVMYEPLGSAPIEQLLFDTKSQGYPRNMFPAFFKRKAFEHEREIRFLLHFPHYKKLSPSDMLNFAPDGSGMLLPLKNADFITRIILDPRLTSGEAATLSSLLNDHSALVEKSKLYDVPDSTYTAMMQLPSDHVHHVAKGSRRWRGNDFSEPGQY